MLTNESRPKPEWVSVEARGFGCPSRISSGFLVGAFVAAAAVASVVVLAALTSWWVLFALFAVCPLLMMVGGLAMMTAMRGPMGDGFGAAGWCASWLRRDVNSGRSED